MEAFDFGDIPDDLPMISVDELLPDYLDDLSQLLPSYMQTGDQVPEGANSFPTTLAQARASLALLMRLKGVIKYHVICLPYLRSCLARDWCSGFPVSSLTCTDSEQHKPYEQSCLPAMSR